MASMIAPDPDSKTPPPDRLTPPMRELADGLAEYLDAFMGEVVRDAEVTLDVDYQYLAEDFVESCVIDEMQVDDCGHHSWAGLMRLLDEHWPDDIFPTRYEDDPKRDAGPRIVSLMRWVDRLSADTRRVEALAAQLDREGVVMLFHGPHNRNQFITARIRAALGGGAR